jgi:hypothetical protein
LSCKSDFNLCSRDGVDERIGALLKEKEASRERPEVIQKIITFFAEVRKLNVCQIKILFVQVFVKYLYLKSNFDHMPIERMVGVLRQHYTVANERFGQEIHQILSPAPTRRITVIRPAVTPPPPSQIRKYALRKYTGHERGGQGGGAGQEEPRASGQPAGCRRR